MPCCKKERAQPATTGSRDEFAYEIICWIEHAYNPPPSKKPRQADSRGVRTRLHQHRGGCSLRRRPPSTKLRAVPLVTHQLISPDDLRLSRALLQPTTSCSSLRPHRPKTTPQCVSGSPSSTRRVATLGETLLEVSIHGADSQTPLGLVGSAQVLAWSRAVCPLWKVSPSWARDLSSYSAAVRMSRG